jgi:hypothetical protein
LTVLALGGIVLSLDASKDGGEVPMAARRKPIRVTDESNVRLLLRDVAAAGSPVLVDTGDALYDVDVHRSTAGSPGEPPRPDPPSEEQVARLLAGIHNAAGGWRGLVDAEELTAYIYERRRMANRPPVEL